MLQGRRNNCNHREEIIEARNIEHEGDRGRGQCLILLALTRTSL